ncbi:MAG: hypothetical protein RMJ56_06100 [Gemmataceae bacterium]|nr:hypothetical protein [Gemmata sp.]MDW8197161.1 hypothetical protein [Gemmataceae bacterium]
MLIRVVAAVTACAVLSLFSFAADPPKVNKFKLGVNADFTMQAGGQSETLIAYSAFEYEWKTEGSTRTLSLQVLEVDMKAGQQQLMKTTMSRAGMFGTQAGQKLNIPFDEAPEQLQTMLRDTFESPLCKIEVDANGKEIKRTILAKPGAKVAIDTGMIANATFFHPPYLADQDEWQTESSVSAGQGLATGTVTLKKVPGGQGGQAVQAKGLLKADNVKADNGGTIKDAKYNLQGTLLYDTNRKEWTAGTVDIDVTFQVVTGNQTVDAKGTMKLKFEALPAKK